MVRRKNKTINDHITNENELLSKVQNEKNREEIEKQRVFLNILAAAVAVAVDVVAENGRMHCYILYILLVVSFISGGFVPWQRSRERKHNEKMR